LQEYNAFMKVTAITRRRHAVLTSFISQVTPSESSVIRRIAMEPLYLHHLRSVLAIKSVKRVAMHEPLTGLYAVIGIQFARGTPETEIWRALDGASTLHRFAGKWIIAVDEDIDPQNADALFWAMSYRCQPQHDLLVVPHKHPGHGPRGPRGDGETASADQCDAERDLRAGRIAQARIHGAGEAYLGTARTAASQAGESLARLRSRLLA
jgi:3-octaprenyl-4-hydroxybenzoate carboxy-lyase